jgi:hypothetical protein
VSRPPLRKDPAIGCLVVGLGLLLFLWVVAELLAALFRGLGYGS